MSRFGWATLIVAFVALGVYLILFRLPRAHNLKTGQAYVLDAYSIEFRQDGTVERSPWEGRYELLGENRICLGGWERHVGGGNIVSTPRGLYAFTLTDREITLTPITSSIACPPWAATISPPLTAETIGTVYMRARASTSARADK